MTNIMYYIGHEMQKQEITCPNTFISYFTAYLMHYAYNSKTRADRKRKLLQIWNQYEIIYTSNIVLNINEVHHYKCMNLRSEIESSL